MKALWEKYFHVPERGNVSEVVFMTRITASLCLIVLCLSAMGFSAYAYFDTSVSSSVNKIVAAYYDLKINVVNSSDNAVEITDAGKGQYAASLTAGRYTVTLEKVGTAQTGFCIVKIGDVIYHTAQIGQDVSAEAGIRETLTFQIEVDADCTVVFTSNWGSSAYREHEESYILPGETVRLLTFADSEDSTNTEDSDPQPEAPSNDKTE